MLIAIMRSRAGGDAANLSDSDTHRIRRPPCSGNAVWNLLHLHMLHLKKRSVWCGALLKPLRTNFVDMILIQDVKSRTAVLRIRPPPKYSLWLILWHWYCMLRTVAGLWASRDKAKLTRVCRTRPSPFPPPQTEILHVGAGLETRLSMK
jgi:hypothetical protein